MNLMPYDVHNNVQYSPYWTNDRWYPETELFDSGWYTRRDAVYNNEQYPPYWINQRWNSGTELFDVEWCTRDAVTNLVYESWKGRAVKHWTYSQLTVLGVQRVENCDRFNDYRRARAMLMKKQIDKVQRCCPVGKLRGSIGDVVTTELLYDSMEFLKRDLYIGLNEHYLFHGTPVGNIRGITLNGFNVGHSKLNNMFGRGIYAGENSTVADVYAFKTYSL